MRVVVAYVFPNLKPNTYQPMARRFVETYLAHPPGEFSHEILVLVNGPSLTRQQKELFMPLPVEFLNHDNSGRDLGAYLRAAKTIECDLLICLGAPLHFWKGGWLDRIVDVYVAHGPGLYGCWGFKQPYVHLRTTAFWLPPELLASYPHRIDDYHRYEFERSRQRSLAAWTIENGLPVSVVGWQSVNYHPEFDSLPPQEFLMLDQHCDPGGPPCR